MNSTPQEDRTLLKQNKNLNAIFESASLGIAVTDMDGKFILMNNAYTKLVGNTREGLLETTILDITYADDVPLKLSLLDKLKTGKVPTFEIKKRYVRADGGVVWAQNNVSLIVNGDNEEPESILFISQDITKEVLLDQEQARLTSVIEHSENFMSVADPDGHLMFVNEAGRNLVGIPADTEITKLTARNFYPQYFIAKVYDEIIPTIIEKGKWSGNIPLRHFTTGEEIPCYGTFSLALDEQGKTLGRTATIRDLRPELAAKRALMHSELQLRNLTTSSPTGLWLSDEAGGLTYLNQTLIDWTGKPVEDLLGHGWANAVIEEDRPAAATSFLSAIAARTHYDTEFRIKKGNGEVIWCRAAGDPYNSEDGSYAGYAGFCMDIDEQKKTAEALKNSESRFRDLIEAAPMPIGVYVGREMRIQTVNQAILDVWGKGSDVVGKLYRDVLPELEGQTIFGLLDHVYTTGETHNSKEGRVDLLVDGRMQTYYFNFTFKALRNEKGEIYGVMNTAVEVTEAVTARQLLAANEARFRNMIMQAPMSIGLLEGRNMVVGTANDSILEIWGKDRAIMGKPIMEALPEIEGQGFIELLEGVYDTGVPFIGNSTLARLERNGVIEDAYFDFVYTPLRDGDDNITGVMVLATEVTAKVLAVQAIQQSEARFRDLIAHAPVAMTLFVGEDMVIELPNERMIKVLGKGHAIEGKPLVEALPELKGQPFLDILAEVYQTGIAYHSHEDRADLIVDGKLQTFYFNFTYQPLFDAAGKVYAILDVALDVTEQVVARQQIMDTEQSLRSAIELAELGTFSLNALTGDIDFSARLLDWFGIDAGADIVDKYNPVPEHDRDRVTGNVHKALTVESGGRYEDEYTAIQQHTGRERILHVQGQTIFDADGKPLKMIGTAQDVTRQRKIQQELELQVQTRTEELQSLNEELASTNEELSEANHNLNRSNEELAQYAYVASHDLQEPLRKIRIFSGMLEKQLAASDDNRALLLKINQSSERMAMLIQDLLSFSRLLYADNQKNTVDLNEIAHTVENDFELSILEQQATVVIGQLPVIEAVGLQMNQLFYNLLGNALKFTKPGTKPVISLGSVTLSMEEAKRHLPRVQRGINYHDITVADNGIGFEVRYAEQIFEVFKRLHGRDVYPGSGIGLALCRRIVANHGGHLYADSKPGTGTTFHLILPDKQI